MVWEIGNSFAFERMNEWANDKLTEEAMEINRNNNELIPVRTRTQNYFPYSDCMNQLKMIAFTFVLPNENGFSFSLSLHLQKHLTQWR